jgi:integrase
MSTALIPSPVIVHAVARRRPNVDGRLTLDALCEHFIRFKQVKVQLGELGKISFDRYVKTCDRVRLKFDRDTPVAEITPIDFMEYRADFPSTWGNARVSMYVQSCRSLFKYGYDSGLLDKPVRFGPSFSKPSKKLFRRERRTKGLQMFEAVEIRAMLEIARRPQIRAMILLGVNCGYGNADCGRLPFSAIDLEGGWATFHRVKTEVDRRCPLWPETIEALNSAIAMRPQPNDPNDAECVFITPRGRRRWANGESATPIGVAIRRLTHRLGIARNGCNFYGLRRTFETIGGESLDQVAVDFIMGHSPRSDDMAAIYRQRISDERLQAVADHVRQWLFPDKAANYFAKFREIARAILDDWEQLPSMRPADLHRALVRTGIKQCELARGIGFNPQWVNTMVRGRAPLSNDAQMRVRTFFEQLSHGKTPTPLPKREILKFDHPSQIPLPEEAMTALYHFPMTKDDLIVLRAWGHN